MAKTEFAPTGTRVSPGQLTPAQRVANPSLAAGEDFEQMYKGLSPHLQQSIASHPLVAGGKLSPAAALNILHYDRKGGESIADTVMRTFVSKPAQSMPTNVAVPRSRGSMMATGVS